MDKRLPLNKKNKHRYTVGTLFSLPNHQSHKLAPSNHIHTHVLRLDSIQKHGESLSLCASH